MIQDGEKQGFDIKIKSSFRSFEAQLNIWNLKAQGKKSLLDSKGAPLNFDQLNPQEVLLAIMRWSAIPGFSRHHWGTDIDVYDAHSIKFEDVELTPQEVAPDGPCGKLHLWLNDYLDESSFFRPYSSFQGGVEEEKWHLSHRHQSQKYYQQIDLDFFIQSIEKMPELFLRDLLLEKPEFYLKQYVLNITH